MPAHATPDRRPGAPASLLVAPFCHSPTRLSAAQRALFRRDLPAPAFEALLRTTAAPLRQNVARVFAAALLAQRAGATLAFVEGWRCHAIEGPAGRAPRLLTGSRLCRLILRMLQRRGLIAAAVRPVCRNASRCTWDEVQAMAALAPADAAIVGIAGFACPSAARARRYLRRAGGRSARVHSPRGVAAALEAGLDPAQRRLLSATRLRLPEAGRLWLFECLNWTLHACSELERRLWGASTPLEQRLAHRLRPDRVPRPPAPPRRVGE
jgi:hypothetical protein